MGLVNLAIRYFFAPLLVECASQWLFKRATDPEFARKSDEAFIKLGIASTSQERNASAKELQNLVINAALPAPAPEPGK